MNLAVSLGDTLASTIMLNIFNNKLSNAGVNLVHGASSSASSFSAISSLPPREQEFIRQKASDGIVVAFYGISSFMWLGVIAVCFLGNVKNGLKKRILLKMETPIREALRKAPISQACSGHISLSIASKSELID
jgi:hypothetical protein